MTATLRLFVAVTAVAVGGTAAFAQARADDLDDSPAVAAESAAAPGDEPAATGDEPAPATEDPVAADESTSPTAAARESVDEVVEDVAEEVDRDPDAQRAKAGVLQPIYALAEKFSFPWFHWIAFAVMVAGVVSFALQLALGKLVVLAKGSISFSEILSDALGLVVSLVGLVLTTQAATENSTFTASAFQVLSATAAGGLAGFIFYLWGQRQEVQAAAGRRAAAATRDVLPPRK